MRQTPQLAIWVAIAVVIAAGAFFGGRSLRGKEGADFAFDYGAIAYDAPQAAAGLSKGGFSGFGSIGDQAGYTIVSGKALDVNPSAIVIETAPGQETTIRLTGAPKVWVLTSGATLKQGDRVVVRLAADGETVEGVFLLGS